MTKKIIMTPPHQFRVEYIINPWMRGNVDTVDEFKAHQQWNDLRNALVNAGVDVIVTETPPKDCPDAVFVANAGLIHKDKFIPSHFKHPERQVEEHYWEEIFEEHHYDLLFEDEINEKRLSFEGAGDALFSANRKILWMGFGHRTSGDFKFVLDKMFEEDDVIVRPLQLVDQRWYHLDTCFCPLDTGDLLWYPEAFSPEAQATIELWYEGKNIKVSEEDALKFACNAVSIGNTIVMPHQTDDLFFELSDRGYNVVSMDMSQFLRSGGACKCLTLEVIE